MSGAKCTIFTGVCIPEQSVIKSGIDSIQGITDIIVICVCDSVSRRTDAAVSIDFGTTTQRIYDVLEELIAASASPTL